MTELVAITIGARASIRRCARSVLNGIDFLTEYELAETGWTRDEIAMLERLAAMRIDGIPFGDWPQEH